MSGFNNGTNQGRVAKIVDTIELLKKSARSNKAGPEDIQSLLAPIVDALADLGVTMGEPTGEPPRVAPEPSQRGSRVPAYVCIKQAAEEASLSDLTYAMAVYLNRIDEHLSDNKEKS